MIAITNHVIPSSSLSNSPLATVAIPLATPPIITKTIMKIKNQIEIDADETRFQTLYTQSQVRNNTEYMKWNWEAILEIIEHYLSNERRF